MTLPQVEVKFWHDHKYQVDELVKYFGCTKDQIFECILEDGLVSMTNKMQLGKDRERDEELTTQEVHKAMPLEEFKEKILKVRI